MNVGRYLRGEDCHVGTARTTQPQPKQREWVELTEEDYVLVNQFCISPIQAAEFVNRLLKERNT
jgi:hypothetical protein